MKTREIKNEDVIVLDYETTGFINDPEARVFAYALTWCDDGHTEIYRDDDSCYEQKIKTLWSSPCSIVAHNLLFELHFTYRMGWQINPAKQLHDTMIMHQYIDNLSSSHALDYLAKRYGGYVREWEDAWGAVARAVKIYKRYDLIPKELMHVYQIADGESEACLYNIFWPLVEPKSEYFNEIELLKTTRRMESTGFMIARDKAKELIREMEQELESNKIEIEAIVGRPINLRSPLQLGNYLFKELGLPDLGSTDKNSIEALREISDHPILDCILKERTYSTGVTTIQGYLDDSEHDGAIHPNIRTNKARTGRESCTNPNLQNVSKETKVGVKYTVAARKCFRARPKYFLILADYAGIEMRLGVQGTNSPRLIDLCKKDFDFHAACAEAFYGTRFTEEKDEKIKKALRSRAKNLRFLMFYGGGLQMASKTIGLPVGEVVAGYKNDRIMFPEFYEFMDRCTNHAKEKGYIETFFGRKLRVEHDRPYSATDYCIQGSAAALFKHAQVAVDKWLSKEIGDDKARCLLPVHDELVIEVHQDLLSQIKPLMKRINSLMTEYSQITVPIKIEFNISMYTWDAKKEVRYE